MKLKWWLLKKGKHAAKEFAELLEIHPNYLYSISIGRLKPSNKIAKKIEKLTEGIVTIDEVRNPEKYGDPY